MYSNNTLHLLFFFFTSIIHNQRAWFLRGMKLFGRWTKWWILYYPLTFEAHTSSPVLQRSGGFLRGPFFFYLLYFISVEFPLLNNFFILVSNFPTIEIFIFYSNLFLFVLFPLVFLYNFILLYFISNVLFCSISFHFVFSSDGRCRHN